MKAPYEVESIGNPNNQRIQYEEKVRWVSAKMDQISRKSEGCVVTRFRPIRRSVGLILIIMQILLKITNSHACIVCCPKAISKYATQATTFPKNGYHRTPVSRYRTKSPLIAVSSSVIISRGRHSFLGRYPFHILLGHAFSSSVMHLISDNMRRNIRLHSLYNSNNNESGDAIEDSPQVNDQLKDSSESNPLSQTMVASIGFYKSYISPLLPPACRFLPTCSQYGVEAIEKFGPLKGGILTTWRILRCSPLGGRGYDPPRWPPVFYTYGSY